MIVLDFKTSFNLKYKHFRSNFPGRQKTKKSKNFSFVLIDWYSIVYPFALARRRTVFILKGLPSIVLKNISLFVCSYQIYFVLLLCSQTETREDKSKNKKSFFHIFTIDLKRFFIRNGNETGTNKELCRKSPAKISTLHCEAETVVSWIEFHSHKTKRSLIE